MTRRNRGEEGEKGEREKEKGVNGGVGGTGDSLLLLSPSDIQAIRPLNQSYNKTPVMR